MSLHLVRLGNRVRFVISDDNDTHERGKTIKTFIDNSVVINYIIFEILDCVTKALELRGVLMWSVQFKKKKGEEKMSLVFLYEKETLYHCMANEMVHCVSIDNEPMFAIDDSSTFASNREQIQSKVLHTMPGAKTDSIACIGQRFYTYDKIDKFADSLMKNFVHCFDSNLQIRVMLLPDYIYMVAEYSNRYVELRKKNKNFTDYSVQTISKDKVIIVVLAQWKSKIVIFEEPALWRYMSTHESGTRIGSGDRDGCGIRIEARNRNPYVN